MNNNLLKVCNLKIEADGKEILKGLNLEINKGEIHVIMGPNGAGKSTLANAIMNNPKYKRLDGDIEFEDENINDLKTDERARKGLFLSFQYPEEIPGITVENFLKYAKRSDVYKRQLRNLPLFLLQSMYFELVFHSRLLLDQITDCLNFFHCLFH